MFTKAAVANAQPIDPNIQSEYDRAFNEAETQPVDSSIQSEYDQAIEQTGEYFDPLSEEDTLRDFVMAITDGIQRESFKGDKGIAYQLGWILGDYGGMARDSVEGIPHLPKVIAGMPVEIANFFLLSATDDELLEAATRRNEIENQFLAEHGERYGLTTQRAERARQYPIPDYQKMRKELYEDDKYGKEYKEINDKIESIWQQKAPVLTAMAKDMEDKYGSAEDFKQALKERPWDIFSDAIMLASLGTSAAVSAGIKMPRIVKIVNTLEKADPGAVAFSGIGAAAKRVVRGKKPDKVEIDTGGERIETNVEILARKWGDPDDPIGSAPAGPIVGHMTERDARVLRGDDSLDRRRLKRLYEKTEAGVKKNLEDLAEQAVQPQDLEALNRAMRDELLDIYGNAKNIASYADLPKKFRELFEMIENEPNRLTEFLTDPKVTSGYGLYALLDYMPAPTRARLRDTIVMDIISKAESGSGLADALEAFKQKPDFDYADWQKSKVAPGNLSQLEAQYPTKLHLILDDVDKVRSLHEIAALEQRLKAGKEFTPKDASKIGEFLKHIMTTGGFFAGAKAGEVIGDVFGGGGVVSGVISGVSALAGSGIGYVSRNIISEIPNKFWGSEAGRTFALRGALLDDVVANSIKPAVDEYVLKYPKKLRDKIKELPTGVQFFGFMQEMQGIAPDWRLLLARAARTAEESQDDETDE